MANNTVSTGIADGTLDRRIISQRLKRMRARTHTHTHTHCCILDLK